MDPLEFLDAPEGADEPVATPAAEAEPAEAPAAETPPAEVAPEEQPRDPAGRFAPKGETPEAAPAREVSKVPLGELLNEREKRQRAEAELERLRQQAQPDTPPDRFEDPEGYEAFQQRKQDARFEQLEAARVNDRLNFSERMARKDHGAETVEQAKKWGLAQGQQNPQFAQTVLRDPDPYEYIVTEYKRAQALSALQDPNTLEQFRQWQAAQAAGPPAAVPAASPSTPAPAAPPRSLASMPSAGGLQTQVVADPFEAEFPKR